MQDLVTRWGTASWGRGKLLRALVLACAAVACASVAVVAWRMEGEFPPAALVAGACLSALGLLAVLCWIAGFLHFTLTTAERPFFDAVADASGDAAVVTDAKGRGIYANAAYLKLASGAGVSRLVGLDVLFTGYPDFSEPIYQMVQSIKAGQPMQRDVRVSAGSSVPGARAEEASWLRLSVAPLAGAAHGGYALWRLQDITSDRLHQESAFSRLQFIITYLDHAPAGFFSTLPNGKVDYVNATLAGWLGTDPLTAQSGGLTAAQLLGEDTARLLSSLEPVRDGFRTETLRVRLVTADGKGIDADIMHRVDFDREGKPMPARSMVLRRAVGKADGEQLGAEGRDVLLQQFANSLPIGICQVNAEGIVQSGNAVFLGLSPKGKLKGSLMQIVQGSRAQDLRDALARSFASPGLKVDIDTVFESTEPRAVRLRLLRLSAEDETVLVFAEDRSESKALEVQLAQSQKMQAVGQLASGIAHDFNNVLTPVIGFADLLLTKMRPTDSAFTDVMNIKQNANRAANLVRQLLAFSRKQTMQPKLHSLTDAMSDLGNLLGRVLGEKVELEIAHGRDLGLVLVDIHQFEQVIINLAVNARDAMPQGGKLSVRTYNMSAAQSAAVKHSLPPADYVVCEVRDTGSGIPADILEKIWEPFFSTKDVGKGTGLGLSMVYGIIKQTGGYIFCDSEMGKGTAFTIFLPRQQPEKPSAAVAAGAKDVPKPALREDFTGRGRILVVEDEDSVRAFAVKALESRGYTVIQAESGERGLETIESDKDGFELILSDVVMPEMDGPTMLAEIRKRGIKTKFVFMSGYAEDAFERNLENPDDFGFLQKPFSLKQLLEKVKENIA